MNNRKLKIAISSGKGGTGKTFVATNIAFVLKTKYEDVSYLDCDVEEPNGHLFIKPDFNQMEDINLLSPVRIDPEKCTLCGKCEEACTYNAIAIIRENVLLFKELCHVCGACSVVCPENAIIEEERKIGVLRKGNGKGIKCFDALLETGEGGMSPRLIKRVKDNFSEGINILDSPPGTACSAVETVRDVDLCILVTDPTPFGVNDLKLSVDMVREIGHEPVIVANRANYRDNKLKEYCKEENLKIITEIPEKREIAEMYSDGNIVAEKDDNIRVLFEQLSDEIINRAGERTNSLKKSSKAGMFKNIDVEREKVYNH
jgi:MinD superfamily P-loop ATPase